MRSIDIRIAKLPKWAQERLLQFEMALKDRDAQISVLQQAHAVLFDYGNWFTIHGPPKECATPDGMYHLFFLGHTGAHSACSLGPGDLLLVGRKSKKE